MVSGGPTSSSTSASLWFRTWPARVPAAVGGWAGSTAFGWSETAIGGSAAAVPRAWMAIDADDAPVPAPLGDAERLVEGAIHVRDRQLPPELCNVTMLVSPTSNSGLRGPTLFRSRLWLGPIRCASGM